jgi:hypothetical protein
MFGINPYLFCLLLGLIGWALMSSAPGAYEYRKAQKEARANRKTS